jgi:hypothetical protein
MNMGTDIHTHVEQQQPDGTWVHRDPTTPIFDFGHAYGVFGFLGGVANGAHVPPISAPRGIPADASAATRDAADADGVNLSGHFNHSWLTVDELVAFDYGSTFLNHHTGEDITFRAFLGRFFLDDVLALARMNAERPTRVVFWFST